MSMNPATRRRAITLLSRLLIVLLALGLCSPAAAKEKKKKKGNASAEADPYAEVVFPPPPNDPRIKLERILEGRADLESKGSNWKKALIGASPQGEFDKLTMPMGVAFDPQGRILVADSEIRAVVRFDLEGDIYDVFGRRSMPTLGKPMSVSVGEDGAILVADLALKMALEYDSDGTTQHVYGGAEVLSNPTDAKFSPDGKRVFVVDSKGHRIRIFDREDESLVETLGEKGSGEGQFSFPTSIAFGPDGEIFVVDQLNSRVQVLAGDGEFIDQFGGLGTGFGNFVRPKSIAVDELGFIYVTDAAFNNFQLFDIDFTLLTFVGSGGKEPGQFQGISGIDVRGEWIVLADTLNRRIQLLRFVVPKTAE